MSSMAHAFFCIYQWPPIWEKGDSSTTPGVEIQASKEQGMVPALALAMVLSMVLVPALASPPGSLPHTEGVQVLPEDQSCTNVIS